MTLDYISEIKVYPGNDGNLIARGSFVVADALGINFSVFKGKDGTPHVVLPNSPNPKFNPALPVSKDNKKFYDEVRPISREAREALEAYILEQVNSGADANPIPF